MNGRKLKMAAASSAMVTLLVPIAAATLFGVYVGFVVPKIPTNAQLPQDSPLSTHSLNSTSGLDLRLSLNSLNLTSGSTIDINISEYNTRLYPNKVLPITNWAVTGLSLGPCEANIPIGIVVFGGYYTLQNVSLAAANANQRLEIYYPGIYGCPAIFAVSYYLFQPNSDQATVGLWNSSQTFSSVPMSGDVSVNGTWAQYGGSVVFQNFAAGLYTVAGGDSWGNLALLHFAIANP